MKNKKIALLMAGILAVMSLAGCGKSADPGTQNQETEEEFGASADPGTQNQETEEESGADGKREISGELNLAIFQGGYGGEYWEELISRFENEYPNVTVKYEISPKIGEILRPKIISGDVPDLISHNQGQPDGVMVGMVKDHQLLDLTDLFEEKALDKDDKLKDVILDGMLESSMLAPYGDGKVYLAPFSTGLTGLVYNKTLFEEKGWEVPTTWDEFFALGDEAKKDGRYLITFPGVYPTYMQMMTEPAIASAAGIDALYSCFNYEPNSFSSENVMKVLENIQKIADGDYLLPGSTGMNHTQSQSEMMLGKALFIPNGSWIENEMKDAPREGDENFAFAIAPSLKLNEEDGTYTCASAEQLSIPVNAKNPEAAKEFIKFIYKDENVKLFGEKAQGMIAVKGGADLVKDYVSESMYFMLSTLSSTDVVAIPDTYTTLPTSSKYSWTEIYEKGLLSVMNKEMTAQEWSADVEKSFEQVQEEIASAE